MGEEEIPFSKQMRIATREIHAVSDALVNAKLAFAMSDNSVWAEGLLVFYEIFRYLEEAMVRLKGTPVGEFHFDELMRTEAFQKDLEFYFGKDWTNSYVPRESVAKYIIHLGKIEKENPVLLVAYIYHLYMGLLSGGQLLSKKCALSKKLLPFPTANQNGGDTVTSFGEHRIAALKRKIVDTVNDIAMGLSTDDRESLLEESKMVFTLNNEMVKSIRGTTYVIIRKLILLLVIVITILTFYYMIYK